MILAIETSTNVCSVSFLDKEGQIHELRTDNKGSHSEQLFRFIDTLSQRFQFEIGDLDCVLVSEGPGSYTGLRIAASAVKGLLFGLHVKLFSVKTLAGFARSGKSEDPGVTTIHAIIDARRQHLYYQRFNHSEGALSTDTGVEVMPIKKVEELISKEDLVIGTGINRLDKQAVEDVTLLDHTYISAKSLIWLYRENEHADFFINTTPEEFEPKYYTSRQAQE